MRELAVAAAIVFSALSSMFNAAHHDEHRATSNSRTALSCWPLPIRGPSCAFLSNNHATLFRHPEDYVCTCIVSLGGLDSALGHND